MDRGYHTMNRFYKDDQEKGLMDAADTALEKIYRAERGMA